MLARARAVAEHANSGSVLGPGGAFDKPIVLSRLILGYAMTGLVALVVVAVVTAWVSRATGTQEAIRDAIRVTALTAEVAIEPVLDDGILTGDQLTLAAVDRVVRDQVLRVSGPGEDLERRRPHPLLRRAATHRPELPARRRGSRGVGDRRGGCRDQ